MLGIIFFLNFNFFAMLKSTKSSSAIGEGLFELMPKGRSSMVKKMERWKGVNRKWLCRLKKLFPPSVCSVCEC